MSRRPDFAANVDPLEANVTSLKISGTADDAAPDSQPENHVHPREANVDQMSEVPRGSAACYHSRGVECELPSAQNASCECAQDGEGAVTRSRKRRMSHAISDWDLVRTNFQLGSGSSSHKSDHLGIVLPSRFLRFCTGSASLQAGDDATQIVVVGMIQSGRIIAARVQSLEKATSRMQSDDRAFAQMISQACAECHSQCEGSEETMARNFVSKLEVCGVLAFPTFESIFDRICLMCFNIQLEESDRAKFLQALHCVCSFKGFQARFLAGRGLLALVSVCFACQSCLSADLALNCIIAISAAQNAAKLASPEMMEALLSMVDTHVSAAPKVAAIVEKWLAFKSRRKYLVDCNVLNRLATQMQRFKDAHSVVAYVRLLRAIMATGSSTLISFIECEAFCAALRHVSSFSTSALSSDPQFCQNVLFSFWQGLDLLPSRPRESQESLKSRELFCGTLVALAQNCTGSGWHTLCAQAFCMVAKMFPDSIFIDQQDNDSLRRNQTIKNTALKLIEGDTLTQQCSVIHSVVNHLLDVASQEDPLRAAVYFCSRLTDPLVASLTGLREITTAPAAHAFGNLVRVGTDLGVCVCPARDNLALVEDTLRRKAMLDEWAPIVSRGEAGDDVCSMCLEALASLGDDQLRHCRCPGAHIFHSQCIENWLVFKQHNNCPLCRHDCTFSNPQ